ncbi:uncharacterized protein PAE49_012492 [Odontesthes bonariensis]|uniref:uncharacterized protein LOC142391176 n=1 Tax=Odontesthes bonariensis TaxID=219752 RepID=UPI003F58FD4F
MLQLLSSVCRYQSFPFNHENKHQCDFLLDLYSHLKDCETKTGLSVLPSLQPVFQSAPAVWSINLSERKSSILLEVLKLQSEKKQVELTGCSHAESEVRSFLQCLPYISQLSLDPESSGLQDQTKFFVNLFCAAAEREQQTGEKMLQLLSSVCRYQRFPFNHGDKHQCDFLLDLYSHLKDCETKTGLSVLPSLQPVFQSAAAVWSINLSERKSSILLEVLKLQSEKKQVKLTGCSHEESEVRSFLQCLPYISQLSLDPESSDLQDQTKFFVNLFCAAAEREQQTGEKMLQLLSSVCRYQRFPFNHGDKHQCDFLLDLYSHLKDCETKTGLSVLPSLQPVFQSAPAVWIIDLSERKSSILLEVLKLQSEKKQVELTGCSHEESEVRSFLQCLPYISQLRRDLLSQQLWKSFLLSEEQMDYEALLGLDGNQLHLPVCGEKQLFERAVEVMQRMSTKVNVCLYWDRAAAVCQSLCESLLEAMPSIGSLSFRMTDRGSGLQNKEKHTEMLAMEKERLFLDICLKTTLHYKHKFI